MSADTKLVERIRDALAAIDPRFVTAPPPSPFAEWIAQAAIPELLAVAEDTSEQAKTRLDALQALREVARAHGVDDYTAMRLAGIAKTASERELQGAASLALATGGHEPFLAAYETRLAADDPRLAAGAAHAMGVAKRVRAVPALIELFATTVDATVRAEAAWALGEIGDPRARPILEQAFKNALALVPVIQALGKLGTADTLALLVIALRDASEAIRLAAAEAVARIAERVPPAQIAGLRTHLAAALERETDPTIGVLLIAGLVRCGGQISRETLGRALGADLGGATVRGALGVLLGRQDL